MGVTKSYNLHSGAFFLINCIKVVISNLFALRRIFLSLLEEKPWCVSKTAMITGLQKSATHHCKNHIPSRKFSEPSSSMMIRLDYVIV